MNVYLYFNPPLYCVALGGGEEAEEKLDELLGNFRKIIFHREFGRGEVEYAEATTPSPTPKKGVVAVIAGAIRGLWRKRTPLRLG